MSQFFRWTIEANSPLPKAERKLNIKPGSDRSKLTLIIFKRLTEMGWLVPDMVSINILSTHCLWFSVPGWKPPLADLDREVSLPFFFQDDLPYLLDIGYPTFNFVIILPCWEPFWWVSDVFPISYIKLAGQERLWCAWSSCLHNASHFSMQPDIICSLFLAGGSESAYHGPMAGSQQ